MKDDCSARSFGISPEGKNGLPATFTSRGKRNREGGYASLEVQLTPRDGGCVVGSNGRRRKKLDYFGLEDIEDSIPDLSMREVVAAGAAAAARVAAGAPEDEEDGDSDKISGKLAIFGLLNLLYVVLQLVGAVVFNSLALLSDSFHNLSDV